MITSRLEDGIVWFTIDGELKANEMIPETEKWLSRRNEYCGYISDVRKMTTASALDKKLIEEQRKSNNTGKPNAILLKNGAMAIIAKVYINFTKAENTKYFTNPEKAIEWLKSNKGT